MKLWGLTRPGAFSDSWLTGWRVMWRALAITRSLCDCDSLVCVLTSWTGSFLLSFHLPFYHKHVKLQNITNKCSDVCSHYASAHIVYIVNRTVGVVCIICTSSPGLLPDVFHVFGNFQVKTCDLIGMMFDMLHSDTNRGEEVKLGFIIIFCSVTP